MKPREFVPGIYSVGAVDWDRRLFDSLIPLPDGTSYNAYLIKGSPAETILTSIERAANGLLNSRSTLITGMPAFIAWTIANTFDAFSVQIPADRP